MRETKTYEELLEDLEELTLQLKEANETIHAIRTGQIDALVVETEGGPQLYTLKSACHDRPRMPSVDNLEQLMRET